MPKLTFKSYSNFLERTILYLKRRNRLLIGLLSTVIIFELGILWEIKYFALTEPAMSLPKSNVGSVQINLGGFREYWSQRIDTIGSTPAYQELKSTLSQEKSFGIQHTATHIIGILIYQKDGLNGIVACDADFGFGCYHGFFGQALSKNGPTVVSELNRACVTTFGQLGTGCLHGIGHGLMEYFGPEKLLEALRTCTLTTQINPLFGCTTGVFMEYNLPIVIDSEGAKTKPRILSPNRPYEPCSHLEENFSRTCYYQLPALWNRTFRSNYLTMGALCKKIGVENKRESCFLGMGNVAAASSEYDIASTIEKCKKILDEPGEVICRAGASWAFLADPRRQHLAPEVCAGLSKDNRNLCVQKSDLINKKDDTN